MRRFRICFSKEKDLKFISHLDLHRAFIRLLRRAGVPLVYSHGFNPQPRIVFASPLPLGLEGKNEYVDVFLMAPWKVDELEAAIKEQLPFGLEVRKVEMVPAELPSLPSLICAALYEVELTRVPPGLPAAIEEILKAKVLIRERKVKKGVQRQNIRLLIYHLSLKKEENNGGKLFMLLAAGSAGGGRPGEILELLKLEKEDVALKIVRQALFLRKGESWETPEGQSWEEYKHLKGI